MTVESGSIFWMFIHGIAYHAKEMNCNKKLLEIIFTIDQSYPCVACRHVIKKYNEIDPYVNRESIFEWTIDLHNFVNKKLNKPIFSKDHAYEMMKSFPIYMVIWKFFICVCKDHVNVQTNDNVNIMRNTVNLFFHHDDRILFNDLLSNGLAMRQLTSVIIDSILIHPKMQHFFRPAPTLPQSTASISSTQQPQIPISSTVEMSNSIMEQYDGDYIEKWRYEVYDETSPQTPLTFSNVRLFIGLESQTISTIENAILSKYDLLINEHSNVDIKFFNVSDTPIHNIENTQISLNLTTTLREPYYMDPVRISVPTTLTRQGLSSMVSELLQLPLQSSNELLVSPVSPVSPVLFDFVMENGEILQKTLNGYLLDNALSVEKELKVQYIMGSNIDMSYIVPDEIRGGRDSAYYNINNEIFIELEPAKFEYQEKPTRCIIRQPQNVIRAKRYDYQLVFVFQYPQVDRRQIESIISKTIPRKNNISFTLEVYDFFTSVHRSSSISEMLDIYKTLTARVRGTAEN